MFYKILKINEIEYPIAVNITGAGEPFVNGAVPGMIYFDEANEVAYIYTEDGSWKIIIGPDVEIDPSCVTKAGVYAIKAVRENNNTSTEIHVNYLDENGEIDDYTSVFVMGVEGNFEETHIFVLTEDKPYGISIESTATCTMYAPVEIAMEALKEKVMDEIEAAGSGGDISAIPTDVIHSIIDRSYYRAVIYVAGIEFTIEKGMTWGEFIDSNYNPKVDTQHCFYRTGMDGSFEFDNFVYNEEDRIVGGVFLESDTSKCCVTTDTIIAGASYVVGLW